MKSAAPEIRHAVTADVSAKSVSDSGGDGVLATFTGTLTTSAEDRDGDVREAKGANIDPAHPLLFNHDTDRPVGKFVGVVERDNARVVGKFAIAATDLGRDAVALIKMGVLRLSIGFKPAEYEPRKGGNGYLVKAFEVVETSLVPVPANREAIIHALESSKFHCPEFIKSPTGDDMKSAVTKPGETPADNEGGNEPGGAKQFTLTEEQLQTIITKAVQEAQPKGDDPPKPDGTKGSGPSADDILNAAAKGTNGGVTVKAASERYTHTKAAGKHCKTGATIRDELGREAAPPSEREHAKAGAFLKHLAARAGVGAATLDDHGRELLEECFKADRWCGKMGSGYVSGIDGMQVKALLNDAISGGAEVVPEWFDADLVQFPLLSGELFPFVDLKPVPRGSSVEGASIDNPSVTWGTPEGTEIALFDTSSLIAAIDTSIHAVTVAIEVGKDLLADSPADVGRTILENVGMRLAAELDRVTAVGNGTSEPEGIFTASGLSDLNSDNGTTGPPTLNDYEALLFGIGK